MTTINYSGFATRIVVVKTSLPAGSDTRLIYVKTSRGNLPYVRVGGDEFTYTYQIVVGLLPAKRKIFALT